MESKKSKFVRISDLDSIRNVEFFFKSEGYSKEDIHEMLGVTYNTWRSHLRSIVSGGSITYDFAKLIDEKLGHKGFNLYYMSGRIEPDEVKEILKENLHLKKKVQELENELKAKKTKK